MSVGQPLFHAAIRAQFSVGLNSRTEAVNS